MAARPPHGSPARHSPHGARTHTPQHGSGGQQRAPFEEYVSEARANDLIASDQAVVGVLRVASNNFRICFVAGGVGGRDICVPSFEMRNRALDGDVVVVEKFPRALWKVLETQAFRQGINVYREDAVPALAVSADIGEVESLLAELNITPSEIMQPRDGDTTRVTLANEADAAALLAKVTPRGEGKGGARGLRIERVRALKSPVELPDTVVQTFGKVIFIKEALNPRSTIGTLGRFPNGGAWSKQALFIPRDTRFPRLMLQATQCPPAFHADPEKFSREVLMSCALESWPATSFFPRGGVPEMIGSAQNLRDCTKAILVNHKINTSPFSPQECSTLPKPPWSPSAEELAVRRDFRDSLVFSIDPPTSRDVDDAMSCAVLPDGTFEVGVHIADVSHFVVQGTALDQAARKRATTTYMQMECYPMLPRQLCDDLCSLLGNVERYSFSVVFHFRPGCKPEPVWMGKSIIKSAAKLAYGHAQSVISGKLDLPFPEIPAPHTLAAVHTAISHLHTLAQELRKERFASGALSIGSPELHFKVDPETSTVLEAFPSEHNESHELIEEFMLLANMAVAQKLFAAYPTSAMLRCHPAPSDENTAELIRICTARHVAFDPSSSQSINESLSTCEDPLIKAALCYRLNRTMQLASYFAADGKEEKAKHFGLHVDLYTHFTSPIRRYADLIVHRQLHAALQAQEAPVPADEVKKIAENCNNRKKAADKAQDDEQGMYLCEYLRSQPQPCVREGIVANLADRSIEVYVPELDLVCRIECERPPIAAFAYNEGDDTMLLTPAQGRELVLRPFTPVMVQISVEGVGMDARIRSTPLFPTNAPVDPRRGFVVGELDAAVDPVPVPALPAAAAAVAPAGEQPPASL